MFVLFGLGVVGFAIVAVVLCAIAVAACVFLVLCLSGHVVCCASLAGCLWWKRTQNRKTCEDEKVVIEIEQIQPLRTMEGRHVTKVDISAPIPNNDL